MEIALKENHEKQNTDIPRLNEILVAIHEYYDADVACRKCAAMLLSNGIDPEPARLMQVMMRAKTKVFKLAGL